MKVLLIQPPYPFSEFPKPSSALMSLGAVLQQEGVEVEVLDLLATRFCLKKIEAHIARFQPHLIGATAVTMNFPVAAQILQFCKKTSPESLTLIGGPHVTFTAEKTLGAYPEVDMIVCGEGEETIRELVFSLDDGKDLRKVRGLAFRHGEEIIRTESRPFIRDIDLLPLPNRTLFPLSRYLAMRVPASIISSRGCPIGCSFCVGYRMMGRQGRFRNPLRVVDDIESALRLGFEEICIDDDLFTRNRRHVLTICEEIRRRRLTMKMYIFARVDTVDAELLQRLKEAGCAMICFGLESGNQEILDRVNKRATLEVARRAVRLCHEAGISPFGSFILGLPGETRKTMEATQAFAQNLRIPYGFHLLAPFPGTRIREEAAELGIRILSDDWSLYDADHAVSETEALPAAEVENFARVFFHNLEARIQEMHAATLQGAYDGPYREEMEKRVEVDFAWKLLAQDLIAELGKIPAAEASGGDGIKDALFPLARRVSQSLPFPESFVRKQLQKFSERGFIVCRRTSSHYQWRWREDP
jgi:anaerobic magnesium-protoporphyrin IX monomethyl ester cyclase